MRRPERLRSRPMLGGFGRASAATAWTFVSGVSLAEKRLPASLARTLLPVSNTRAIGKRHMAMNDAMPKIQIDPERYTVTIDSAPVTPARAVSLPLAQRYFLF